MSTRKGRYTFLTEADKVHIRECYINGDSVLTLQQAFGCSEKTVYLTIKGCINERHERNYQEKRRELAQILPTDLAWCAGILDGEGSFTTPKIGQSHCQRLCVASTDPFMVPRLRSLLGGVIYPGFSDNLKCKDELRWQIDRLAEVAAATEALLPYLHVKHLQAQLVLRFAKSRMQRKSQSYTEEERAWITKIGLLNERGRRGQPLLTSEERESIKYLLHCDRFTTQEGVPLGREKPPYRLVRRKKS